MPSSTSAIVLPLPLAQLRARATYAKSPSGRLHAWYYLWEAMVKLLAVQGIIECSARQLQDPELEPLCASLRHPQWDVGGDWPGPRWRIGQHDYRPAQALRQGLDAERDDLPKAARLEAELRRLLSPADAKVRSSGSSVRIGRLFDQLVQYTAISGRTAWDVVGGATLEQLGQVFAEAMAEIVRHGRLFDFGRIWCASIRSVDWMPATGWIERFLEGSEPQPLEKQYFQRRRRATCVLIRSVASRRCARRLRNLLTPTAHGSAGGIRHRKPALLFSQRAASKTTAELLCYTSGDDRRLSLNIATCWRLLGRPANDSNCSDGRCDDRREPHNTTADPETRRLGGL
ncbi:MAG: hypothetical protein U0935_19480 [Pirellulales bacterium]